MSLKKANNKKMVLISSNCIIVIIFIYFSIKKRDRIYLTNHFLNNNQCRNILKMLF